MITDDIETPRLLLACLREEHATENYLSWLNSPEINRFLESRFSISTLDSLREYIQTMRASTHSYLFGVFSRQTGTHYGNIKLGPISPVHATAVVGLVLGDKAVWGIGLASESISAISEWAFGRGVEKITAGSYQSNGGSIRAFQKCGFEIEGIQRSQVRLDDGSRDDVVLLGRVAALAPRTVK